MPADQPKPASPEPEKLRKLGKYQIVRRLGAGGMGAVFLATDTELRRAVALKVLPKDRAENPTLVRRFKSEAQAVAQLRHDKIVAIYETGQIDGFPYLALEYVDGQDLLSIIDKRGPLPPKRSLMIVRQVAEALQHAYERNIVHRDIKPSNLLVQVDGTCKITDFGLARTVDEAVDTSITRAGTTVGTVDYIAPEQAVNSKAADIRSDIYSLGCTWYHMLTGSPPFPDGNLQTKLHAHMSFPPPSPRALNPNVPEAYVAVMQQMMAKKPEDRYQTPADLLADLDKVVGSATHISAELFDETPTSSRPSASGKRPDQDTSTLPRMEVGPKGTQPRGAASRARRSDATESAPGAETEVSRVNPKWKGRGDPVRGPEYAPGSSVEAEVELAASSSEETPRPSRKLSRRRESDATGFSIDLDFARIGLIALVAVGAAGLFWWAFSRGDSWKTRAGESPVALAAAAQPAAANNPAAPQAPDPNAPQAPAGLPAEVPTPAGEPVPRVELLAGNPVVSREGPALPGLEDLEHTSPAMREWLPDWVYAIRNAAVNEQSALTLHSPPRPGEPATLGSAILTTTTRERLIDLHGPGPFRLQPVVVRGCDRLVIRGAGDDRPLIIVESGSAATGTAGNLHLIGGVLELRNVHLVAESAATGTKRSLLSVAGGTLVMRDCSVTVPDESAPVTVAQVRESATEHYDSRVYLENALIRGASATAIEVAGARADIVVSGSLLASDTSPLVVAEVSTAAGSEPASEGVSTAAESTAAESAVDAAAPKEPVPAVIVRVLGSVLRTRSGALRLSQPPSDEIQRGLIQTRRSLLGSGGGEDSVLLDLAPWPARSTNVSGQPRIAGLRWRQESTWLAGWPTLVRLGDEAARSPGEWETFWGQSVPADALTEAPLPSAGPVSRIGSAALAAWVNLAPRAIVPGARPGVAAAVPEPPQALLEKLLLLSRRPQLPAGFGEPRSDAPRLSYDLRTMQKSLPELLASAEIPDGASVQLSGIGLVSVPPITLRNKTLRLEFLQAAEGAPLTIRPEAPAGKTAEAFITVDGGRLELIGARIQSTPSRTRSAPATLLLVHDADLVVRNCQLEGGPIEGESVPAIIDWRRTAGTGPRRCAWIADTQVVGPQPLLTADVDRRLLVVENCLLAGTGQGLELRSGVGAAEVAPADEGWVVLDHNTFLTGQTALRLSGNWQGRSSPAVRVVSTACVFAPTPGASTTATAVLAHPDGMPAGSLFDWWESRNGYAPAIRRFRVAGAATGSEQLFDQEWVRFWGPDHVEMPHSGVNGVVLATVLTSLNRLSPPDVALARACTATSGDVDGGPIGIRVTKVGPLGRPAVSTTPPGASGTPATPRTPPGRRPDF